MNVNWKVLLRNLSVLGFIVVVIGFSSCDKYVWDPPVFEVPDTPVYYATQVAPLFPAHSCTNCHSANSSIIDLSLENSWESLTNGRVDLDDPEASKIIVYIDNFHMGGMESDGNIDRDLILTWIYQGALDN